MTIKLTNRALVARINRSLAACDQKLRKSRGERARFDLGDYFVVDVPGRHIIDKYIDVEALGRELGVLRPSEQVAQEGRS